MLKIRLFPRGKKHQRSFRIVVAEENRKFNGLFVADLGFWLPQENKLQINKDALVDWTKKGAQVTEGVDKLLNPEKYPRKKKNKPEAKTAPKAEKPPKATSQPTTDTTTTETPVSETPTEVPATDAPTDNNQQ